MEVDQVIKLLEVTSGNSSKSKKKSSKSSSKRPKKSFLDSLEERFWVLLIFSMASAYIFLWFFGRLDAIYEEIDIFNKIFIGMSKEGERIRYPKKTNYEVFIEKDEFRIEFDRLEEQEIEFGARKLVNFNYKQLNFLISELNKQRETNLILQEHLKNKGNVNVIKFNDINNNLKIYSEIIEGHFARNFELLFDKIHYKFNELKRQIGLLRQNVPNASKLLDKKQKFLDNLNEEVKKIILESKGLIQKMPKYSDPIYQKVITAKLYACKTFFSEIYKTK